MGFSTDSSIVRVDFFRESGKWYTTEAIKWDRYKSNADDGSYEHLNDTLKRCVNEQLPGMYRGMTAVCLEPYHEHPHPIMVKVEG